MSKFEVGQKWKTDDKHIVTVVYKNDMDVVVECEDKRLVSFALEGAMEYFAEQVVEPKYRPFKNAEEYRPYRGVWVKHKSKDAAEFRVGMFDNNGIEFCNYAYDWKSGFDRLTFECGTPFGMEVKS